MKSFEISQMKEPPKQKKKVYGNDGKNTKNIPVSKCHSIGSFILLYDECVYLLITSQYL